MHILRGLKHGTDDWFLQTRTVFVFIQNRLIFHAYIHFKTLILLFTSFYEIFWQKIHFAAAINFLNNPLPPTPRKLTVMCVNVCRHKFTCTNVTPKWPITCKKANKDAVSSFPGGSVAWWHKERLCSRLRSSWRTDNVIPGKTDFATLYISDYRY